MLRQALTIQTTALGAADAHGVESIVVTATTAVLGEIQQKESIELQVDRDTVISNWSGIFAPYTAITPYDRVVTADGRVFEVVDHPWPAFNPRTGHVDHIEVNLRTVEG